MSNFEKVFRGWLEERGYAVEIFETFLGDAGHPIVRVVLIDGVEFAYLKETPFKEDLPPTQKELDAVERHLKAWEAKNDKN